jgi:glutathione S-transferase
VTLPKNCKALQITNSFHYWPLSPLHANLVAEHLQEPDMDLYFAPGTIARASLIALHEAELPFTPKRLDFSKSQQQSPEYLAINPKGRVPALVTDAGILTETPAILAFIATLNPARRLAPADPFQFAKMQEFNSFLASTVHVNHAHRMRGSRWADQQTSFADMAAKVPQTMTTAFTLIETEYLAGPWVMGDQYTVADPYLFAISNWLAGDTVDIAQFPKAAAHFAAMNARPAVQKALNAER